jgi:hypothetical protein
MIRRELSGLNIIKGDMIMKQDNDNGSTYNTNPDNELNNSVPKGTEIEQPNPSTATPPIPQEIPIREG